MSISLYRTMQTHLQQKYKSIDRPEISIRTHCKGKYVICQIYTKSSMCKPHSSTFQTIDGINIEMLSVFLCVFTSSVSEA